MNVGPKAGLVLGASLSKPNTDELLKVATNKLRLKKAEAVRARLFVWKTGLELKRGETAELRNDTIIAVSLGEDYAGQAAQMPVAAQRWEELSYKFQTLRAALKWLDLEWLERPSCQSGDPYRLSESDWDAIDVIRLASTNISMLAQAEDSEAEYLLEPDLLLELQRLIKLGGLGSAHSYHALFTACNRDFECEKFKAHSKAVKEWQASERNAGKFWTTLAAARESNEIRVANPIEDYEAGGHLSYVHGEIDYD